MNNTRHQAKYRAIPEFIFFGNYFYGICAVALSIEAMLQQRVPLNGPLYFVMVFLATVLYYTYPYMLHLSDGSTNPRTRWYARNYIFMKWNQVIITVILSIATIIFLWHHGRGVGHMPALEWVLLLIFPVAAALYYGADNIFPQYNLRRTGWLKPFVIGFTWAGFVNIYPVLWYNLNHGLTYTPTLISGLLFLKNFMFVTVLCIMFDIKDYASDYLTQVKTFVVRAGLRKTIFYILLPLAIIGLASFVVYGATHQFSIPKLLLNTIPFLLLMTVAFSLRKRRRVLYYLVIIDGLMLVKAICGSIAMMYF